MFKMKIRNMCKMKVWNPESTNICQIFEGQKIRTSEASGEKGVKRVRGRGWAEWELGGA